MIGFAIGASVPICLAESMEASAMIEIIYLAKGQRRPAGDRAPLIVCKRGREEIGDGPEGATIQIRPEALDTTIAGLERKGASKVYVRGATDA